MNGNRPVFWTIADAAEEAVLIDALVRGAFDHRERCSVCKAGPLWCAGMREALTVLLEWRQSRRLLSKAEWLREQQDLRAKAAA